VIFLKRAIIKTLNQLRVPTYDFDFQKLGKGRQVDNSLSLQ